jgi:transglutaminase-like putative cysteine protease
MAVNALRKAALFAAAWGLLAITLSGEISSAWLWMGWFAWGFSLISSRYPMMESAMRRLETPAVLAMIFMLLMDFFFVRSTLFIAITHFLLLFQSFKLIGLKERKDGLQIFLFSFFQALAACTLSVDAWNAVILLALILTAILVLFWNQMAREYESAPEHPEGDDHRRYRRMAVLIGVLGLPMTLVLTTGVFVIFPRLAFNAPLPGRHSRRMGYSDQLNLAEKGNLEENSAVVFWLTFPKSAKRPEWDGHIRGDVLSAFDGHQWSVMHDRTTRTLSSDPNGIFTIDARHSLQPALHQRITLADASGSTLFFIGRPLRVIAPVHTLRELEGGTLHWDSLWRHPVTYDVFCDLSPEMDSAPPPISLPSVSLRRVQTLADRIAGQGPPFEQAKRMEGYLQKNYRYSTDFGEQVAANPVDYFLFERRQGACGHFASAMAVMLRLRGIPSRVVAGYWQGEWNDPAQAIVVRERDAHAWVEAYIPEMGWMKFDPTPTRTDLMSSHSVFFTHLREYDDYLSLLWSQFVIQYDLYAQIRAFENLRSFSNRLTTAWAVAWPRFRFTFRHGFLFAGASKASGPEQSGHRPLIELGLILSLSAMGFLFLSRRSRISGDPAIRFYARFLEKMARAGHPKQPSETGWEYASRLAQALPGKRPDIAAITHRYYRMRFARPL